MSESFSLEEVIKKAEAVEYETFAIQAYLKNPWLKAMKSAGEAQKTVVNYLRALEAAAHGPKEKA